MDLLLLFIVLIVSIFCFLLLGHHRTIRNGANWSTDGPGQRVPEAAGSWPIIGHLHLLVGSKLPHELFGSMADKFGPIFTIKHGANQVLIVSNSKMAKECFTTNDIIFASRPKALVTELMGHNCANLGLAPYGPYWRDIRKIVVLELLSHRRLQMLAHIRATEVRSLIVEMYKNWERNKGSSEVIMVDMKLWFENLIVNMVVRMIFGNRLSSSERNEENFKNASSRFLKLVGEFVPSDALPSLRWLDLGGYEKMMKTTAKELDIVLDGWLVEHKKKMDSTEQEVENKDQVFMATLLSRVKQDLKENLYGFSTEAIVKATCLAIFVGATDTTTATLTWALALLGNNPLVLKRAQQELEKHVGRDREVEESDMKNLVYLQAIIKETLRRYPAAPLGAPHESTEDCVVGGYNVPKGTRLLVNIWKIHHDPQIWTDPFEFQPERFLTNKKKIDVKGQHFELIPFGSGRRMCLGISIALEAVQFILARIIHGFEFQNPSNDPIDMTGSSGLTNHKATPLELLVAPRLSPHVYGVSA